MRLVIVSSTYYIFLDLPSPVYIQADYDSSQRWNVFVTLLDTSPLFFVAYGLLTQLEFSPLHWRVNIPSAPRKGWFYIKRCLQISLRAASHKPILVLRRRRSFSFAWKQNVIITNVLIAGFSFDRCWLHWDIPLSNGMGVNW